MFNLSVRTHNETVLVDLGEGCKRRNKTDVLTFRGFNGAKSAVVRVVNVADLERRSVAVKTAGTEGGKLTLVGKLCRGVGLVHELRKLGRTEELADNRGDGTNVDKPRRSNFHSVLRRHTLFNELFKPCDTYAELVLE